MARFEIKIDVNAASATAAVRRQIIRELRALSETLEARKGVTVTVDIDES